MISTTRLHPELQVCICCHDAGEGGESFEGEAKKVKLFFFFSVNERGQEGLFCPRHADLACRGRRATGRSGP